MGVRLTHQREVEKCSFCQKKRDEVDKLIAGVEDGVYLCNECVDQINYKRLNRLVEVNQINERCSFCRKSRDGEKNVTAETRDGVEKLIVEWGDGMGRLIAGRNNAFICDKCVGLFCKILAGDCAHNPEMADEKNWWRMWW